MIDYRGAHTLILQLVASKKQELPRTPLTPWSSAWKRHGNFDESLVENRPNIPGH
jgi:hypothetical protein